MYISSCNARSGRARVRGFTLIELLLYLSLSVIMLSVLGGIGVNLLESRARSYTAAETAYNAQSVLERITDAVHEAESIESPLPGATSTTLSLTMRNPSKTPTVFEVVDGTVYMREGAGDAVDLSTAGARAELSFLNVTPGGTEGSVRVTLIESAPVAGLWFMTSDLFSRRFYTTAHIFFAP